MKGKKIAVPFLIMLLLAFLPTLATADNALGIKTTVSSADVMAGDEVEVIASLTGYTETLAAKDAIRGVQVDITNVDSSVLEVVEYASLIEDTTALSNTASYQSGKKLVRLLYAQMNGTLAAPCEGVMKVKFRVASDVAKSGSITLPVTVKIQTEAQQLTFTDEIVITYTAEERLGISISPSSANVQAGEEVEVIASLTGYTETLAAKDAIRGVQVDITNVDSSVLEVVEYASLIEDTTALSNTASYQSGKKLVRLLYAQMNGTLAAPCEGVMKVKFRVALDVAKSGSITLPVTVKIQTEAQQLTFTDEIVITYTVEERLGISISPSSANVQAGEEVEVIASLTGYTETLAAKDAIRGVQVDITNVDSSVLEVVEYASLIEDTTALSNTASYQSGKKLVRLLYAQMNGTLAAPCEGVMKVKFRVAPDVAKSGSITLPVTVKIQTKAQQLTFTDEIVITYTADETKIISVDIVWGAMEFVYSDGTWNQTQHRYEGAGWTDAGSGYITLRNVGSVEVTTTFAYQTNREDVTGKVVNAAGTVAEAMAIAPGEETTVYLRLSGKPGEVLDKTTIGSVTVRIGG